MKRAIPLCLVFLMSVAFADSDGDGIEDANDNCPTVANSTQIDFDSDGLGDQCDLDDDNDNVFDDVDNCPFLWNSNQLDNDGDGLGDRCDPDDDNDGILETRVTSLSAGETLACGILDSGIVKCWGSNDSGQLNVPHLIDPQKVVAGSRFACALDKNLGNPKVICWGNNQRRQLNVFEQPNIVDISAGRYHACALGDSGIHCWGDDRNSQRSVPNLVNPNSIFSEHDYSCALENEKPVCWGYNGSAQLEVPESIQITQRNFTAKLGLSAKGVCALSEGGGVACWPSYYNFDHRISLPLINNPVAIDGGVDDYCLIDDDGVKCWGRNSEGAASAPSVQGPISISAGSKFACASHSRGVSCWGYNEYGVTDVPPELTGLWDEYPFIADNSGDFDRDGLPDNLDDDDDNDGINDSADALPLISIGDRPDNDQDGLPDICDAICRETGLTEDTDDDNDELSDVDEQSLGTDPLKPDSDADGLSDYFEARSNSRDPLKPDYFLAVGPNNSCVFDDDKKTKCWGRDEQNLLSPTPVRKISGLDLGSLLGCAIDGTTGYLRCWGSGFGTAPPPNPDKELLAIGDRYVCAGNGDSVKCKGLSSVENAPFPLSEKIVELDGGNSHACILLDDGRILCWGGYSSEKPSFPGTEKYRSLVAGGDITCGITEIGGVLDCFANGTAWETPVLKNVLSISIRAKMACSNDFSGTLCWGETASGFPAPQPNESLSNSAIFGVGHEFACALDELALHCWGNGADGAIREIPPEDLRFGDFDADDITDDIDEDDDNDGIIDVLDPFPLDPSEFSDLDGDGLGDSVDEDDDGDGVLDDLDAFPLDPEEFLDSDSDGVGNNQDLDDDGDEVPDVEDSFPLDSSEHLDTDGDGVGDNSDLDDDGDGVNDISDAFPRNPSETLDTDGDGVGNNQDLDDDGDGVEDLIDAFPLDPTRSEEETADSDFDGQSDFYERQCGSNPEDASSISADFDEDLIPDCADEDDDNDGIIDAVDFYPYDPNRSNFGGQKALIVAGGGPYSSNFLWPSTKNMANYAYSALKFQGLTDEDIDYLSEEVRPEVDGAPTTENILQRIKNLAAKDGSATDSLIYFVDHGGNEVFRINKSTLIDAHQIKVALDDLQSNSEGSVIFIYDACQSGSFLPILANQVLDRSVITSTDTDEAAVFAVNGYTSFSFFFWSSFFVGADISEATRIAKRSMTLLFDQNAQVDIDGDGASNTKNDLRLLSKKGFGQGAQRASDFPRIGSVELPGELAGDKSITVRAVGVTGSTDVARVSVYVESPDKYFSASNEPVLVVNRFSLDQVSEGNWEGQVGTFDVKGNYKITVVAENRTGLTSLANLEDQALFELIQTKGRLPFIEGDADGDGVGDLSDLDDDNDGTLDTEDAFPLDPSESSDADQDGIGNSKDNDDDNDGIEDSTDEFPYDSFEWADADADGVGDNSDAFPLDPAESLDSDGDQVGDNLDNCPLLENQDQLDLDGDDYGDVCDTDDDGDGFTDEEELADGTNPLSRFSCRSGCFSFDIDENKEAKALSDGLLVIRHLFGFSGDSLTSGATTAEGARTSAEAISSYLSDAESELDIDGDGQSKALTDGLLLIRYLFGFSGDSLTAGAIGEDAERTTAEEIQAYIGDRVPSE
jgi:hypothetical protein